MKTRKEPIGLLECTNCGNELGPLSQSHLTNEPDGSRTWTCQTPEPQHTQTPWKLEDRVIKSINGSNVTGLVPSRMTNSDAAFIVRAVNSHDELFEMLQILKDCFSDDDGERDNFEATISRDTLAKCEAILAKAEVK